MAAAQQAGKFKDEIVPMKTKMKVVDKETKEESDRRLRRRSRRVQPPRYHAGRPGQAASRSAAPGNFVTAGNASQLSDGAAAVVLMEAKEAERRGLEPLGAFKAWAVAGCEPDEMGIGPVFAVPRLLKRHGLKVDDIDLWELNEAFASQCLYCRDKLGIDPEKYNVNGGSIAIGHPFGMTGARWPATCCRKARRRSQVGRRHHVHRRRHGRAPGCSRSTAEAGQVSRGVTFTPGIKRQTRVPDAGPAFLIDQRLTLCSLFSIRIFMALRNTS